MNAARKIGFRVRSRSDGRHANRPVLPAFTTDDPIVGYHLQPEPDHAFVYFCRKCAGIAPNYMKPARVSDLFDDQEIVKCHECGHLLYAAPAGFAP
jgi:hypothetical protein